MSLISTSEVAERFGVSTSTVRRWVDDGTLTPTFTTPGGHYRFSEDALADLPGGAA